METLLINYKQPKIHRTCFSFTATDEENRKSKARDTKEEEEVQNGEDRLSTLCVKEKHSTSALSCGSCGQADNGRHTGCPLPHTGMVLW